MIWEVDEDHDGKVGWTDFEHAYERCSNDMNGTEPRQLYNVVLFALHAGSGGTGGDGSPKVVLFDLNEGNRGKSPSGGTGLGKDKLLKMSAEDAARLMYLQYGRVRNY